GDIANSPVVEGYNPVRGDIKYADTNADGIINVFDETAIGSTRPLVFYGLTAGLSWKGFDFSMVWHGVANRNVWTNNSNSLEFQQNSAGGYGQAFAHHLQRWTPATASTATYPRLTLADNVHNQRNSTFWLKNGSYARLRNVEIGYQVPKRWLALAGIKKARAFVNGANLITLTKLERLDPEGIGWNYPIQKAINFGLNIQL
ncbi:MAG TPA: SusC/RagA family TonB-linked outer membrane protein, partial [Phnomibacter sp.]|nr:SusC/RagA family TonB-linked outer membrane protein [Phnomibacter sp.]